MPKARIAQSFEEILLKRYPLAAELAVDRFLIGKTNLFNSHKRKARYPKALIVAALWLAIRHAHKVGEKLKLTKDEKDLWRQRFEILELMLLWFLPSSLLLPSLFDFWQ